MLAELVPCPPPCRRPTSEHRSAQHRAGTAHEPGQLRLGVLETYAVLTGFPPPHRAAPGLVDEWLADRFSTVLEPPTPGEQRHLVHQLAAGGAVYDALVALTAQRAGAILLTADARAAPTYELVGVELRRLGDAEPLG